MVKSDSLARQNECHILRLVLYFLNYNFMDKHTHTHADGTTHSHPNMLTGVYGAIAGALIISLLGTYLIVQNQQVEQVGGRENYKLYQKMVKNPKYGENIKGNLDAQIAQME